MYTSALYGHKYDKSQQISAISEENQSARHHTALAPLLFAVLFPFTTHVPTTTHQNKNNRAERDQTEPRRKEATGEGERGGREPRLHLIFLPIDHLFFFSTQDNESSNRASERGFGGATPIFHRGRHRRQRTPTHAYILVFSFPFHVFSPSFSSVLGFGVTLQRERQIKRGVLSFSFLFCFRFRL